MIILNKEYREIYSREVTREIPNSETISAINEVQQMKQNPSLGKSYKKLYFHRREHIEWIGI